MRYVNSALFGRHEEVQAIERALMIVGSENIRRWVALATLSKLATDKPGELTTLAIVRARFCELLMQLAGIPLREEGFLMGMFSLLDALLDRPLDEALRSAGIGPDIAQALFGTAPEQDRLSTVYRLARRYELGDWDEVEKLAGACGLVAKDAGEAYVEATLWADRMLHAAGG